MKNYTEYFGCLTKVENLWCLEAVGIHNTCLLESFDVFPGYYGSHPSKSKPRFLYIVSDEAQTVESILRITKKVKKNYPENFDAALAQISMRHNSCYAVRITGIEDYSKIKKLQEVYQDMGLSLKKKVKNIENEPGVIKIYKIFKLIQTDENIYLDGQNPDIGYFKVKEDLEWEKFSENIRLLRNNLQGKSFDAAKCFIIQDSDIIDMVRIYSKDLYAQYLEELRTKYCSLFNQ